MKRGVLAALALLLATGAHAEQRRQRPSSPSPGPVAPRPVLPPGAVFPSQPPLIPAPVPTPAPTSPFDARPNTYAPHYNDARPRSGGGVPYYSGAVGIAEYAPPADSASTAQKPPDVVPPPAEPPRVPAPAPVPEAPKVASLHPDTFYVIPGCYAGNRPPNPARLPKGCDLGKMITNPIR